jgi:alkylhydroperoxidase/carboxymuconolactone decarboxylase family protein YurZ
MRLTRGERLFSGNPVMTDDHIDRRFRDCEERLERVEQYLPQLPTRADLHAAVAPLATREELRVAIAPLATRAEMRAEIEAAVAPLATREEMHTAIQAAIAPLATREEMYSAITAEGERSRRHATVLFEDSRDDIRIILEHLVAISARVDELARR